MTKPHLQAGRALVITGPQGCGKTTMARELAKAHGGYFDEIDASRFDSGLIPKDALESGPRVLIVNGLPNTRAALACFKQLISSAKVSYRPAYSPHLVDVAPPILVFTTNDTQKARELAEDTRRFNLLELSHQPSNA